MKKSKLCILALLVCFLLSACVLPNISQTEDNGIESAATASATAADSGAVSDSSVAAGSVDAADTEAAADTVDAADSGAAADSSTAADTGTATAPAEIDLDDTGDVTISEDAASENGTVAVDDLGSTTFSVRSVDTATVSEPFMMDGPEKTMLLWDDKRNITWKLTVPQGALLRDTKIRMTLLYGISGSEKTGSLDCGILLEPDGLQFIKPAMLTVEGDDEHTFAYSANQDGSNLDRACVVMGNGDMAIPISHFSLYALKEMTQEEFDKLKESEISKAETKLKSAIEEAKRVVKEPIRIPPLQAWSKCLLHDEESETTQKAYEALGTLYGSVASPEYDVLFKMHQSLSIIAQCGVETTQSYESLMNNLSYRQYKKAGKILKEYGKDEETIIPAIHLSMRLLRDATPSDGISREMTQELINEAGFLALKASKIYLDEVGRNHDYCSFSAAMSLARDGSILNNEAYKTSSVQMDSLIAAMKFKFSFDGKIIGYSREGNTNTYTVHATIPDIKDQRTDGNPVPCVASGEVTAFESINKAHMKASLPETFEIVSFLELHYPCEEAPALVYVDKPAPTSMTYFTGDNDEDKMVMPFFKLSWLELFEPHLSERQGYHIEIKLVNGHASNKMDLTNTVDYGKIEYQFMLEHIP